jgi:hypothetical protein
MIVPNMIGLVLGRTWDAAAACLRGGGTPAVCSQKSGLDLVLTQFFAQTDLMAHGPIKLLFKAIDGTDLDIVAIHGTTAVFGHEPIAGKQINPGEQFTFRIAPTEPVPGAEISRLGRFPVKGDTGFEVLELQQALTDHGFPTKTDGHWDDETEKQRIAFAHSVGLLTFISVPAHQNDHAATIERVWLTLGLPINEVGMPGLSGPAGVFPLG